MVVHLLNCSLGDCGLSPIDNIFLINIKNKIETLKVGSRPLARLKDFETTETTTNYVIYYVLNTEFIEKLGAMAPMGLQEDPLVMVTLQKDS